MNKLKDTLLTSLGWFGMAIYYAIYAITAFSPLVFLDLPFLAELMIIGVVMFVPFLQNAVRPVIWIAALVAAIRGTIDVFAIVYFVFFAIYALAFLLQDLLVVCRALIAFISAVPRKKKRKKKGTVVLTPDMLADPSIRINLKDPRDETFR